MNDLVPLQDLFGKSEETKIIDMQGVFVWCLPGQQNGRLISDSGLPSVTIETDTLGLYVSVTIILNF